MVPTQSWPDSLHLPGLYHPGEGAVWPLEHRTCPAGKSSLGLADARNLAHAGTMSPKCLTFSPISVFFLMTVLVSIFLGFSISPSLPFLFYTWVSASPKTGLSVSICLSVTLHKPAFLSLTHQGSQKYMLLPAPALRTPGTGGMKKEWSRRSVPPPFPLLGLQFCHKLYSSG